MKYKSSIFVDMKDVMAMFGVGWEGGMVAVGLFNVIRMC